MPPTAAMRCTGPAPATSGSARARLLCVARCPHLPHLRQATAAPKPPTKPSCTVPKLKGKSLTSARKLLSAAHCALGKVSRPRVQKHHRLGPLVIGSQTPAPGRRLAGGGKVAVVLVKAPKHTKRR